MTFRLDPNGLTAGKVSLTPGVLFGAAAALYLGCGTVLRLCLLAAALHELGHILFCLLLNIPVQRFRLTLTGAVLDIGARCRGGWEELLVALAGPLANLLTAFAALPLPLPQEERCLFAGASVMLAVFNLLPAAPLDGSRALHGLLTLFLPEHAERITQAVSRLTGLLLLVPGIYFALHGNGSLLILVLWLVLQQA